MKISYVDQFGKWTILKNATYVEIETDKAVDLLQGKLITIKERGEKNSRT